ncbi:MAG: PKD domain-containing protein [Chthoniobacterales bacterium]
MRRVLLFLLSLSCVAHAERINHEGRILGSAPIVTAPILFNTPAADAIVSAMQIMPRDNPWNEDISRRPILANSDAMIAQIKADLGTRQTLQPFYEMNYVLVPDNQPRVQIPFLDYPDESDLDGGTYPNGLYPVPANQPIESWPKDTGSLTLQQWQQDVNNNGGDRHGIMVTPGVGSVWETWQMKLTPSGWQASNGAKFNLNSNALRPAGWTSGDAAGLSMFAATVRYDECERGMVEHALRLVVKRSRKEYLYPATHFASSIPASSTNYPAMGQRLRLKANFAIPANWTIEEKAVLLALKKYGAIVADNGNFFSVSVCPDDRFSSNSFSHLTTIDINNFEVVQTTGPNEGPRSAGAPTVDAGPDQFLEFPTSISLNGSVNDPSGRANVVWKLYSGPSGASFANTNQAATTVTINAPGTYTFMLSADDSVHTVAYDAVVVRVTGRDALANLATRVQVGAANNVAIAGFIVTGNSAKQIVIRGLGPSLAGAGVQGALNDPLLELYDASGNFLSSNNDWQDTHAQALRDANLAPTNDLESAILTTLAPGAYTVILRGNAGATGIGLVELYDLQISASSKLGNLSTRGLVGADQSVMIGGTIVTGQDNARVAFRALGPSLSAAGIANALADPELNLFDVNGTRLASNNNWKDSQQSAIASVGLAPANDLESAIVIDLAPGNYTAVVSGVNGTNGVALVEAYHLQ